VSDKITPFLWFDGQAEEAANFYVSVFKDAKMLDVSRYAEGSPGEPDSVMTVEFELAGLRFVALNGGPEYTFTPAISFQIDCANQDEVDWYWSRLGDGGREVQCGWLQDKYGLSWQVVPSILPELLGSDDRAKAGAAMQAMLGMVKLDIKALQAAYDNG
jgi:predicted 3-demethylubiquinone-9 3-methyltransferase (glyoxalase superfamily)